MKNNITCFLLLLGMLKNAHGIHDDPADIIRSNIANPTEAIRRLSLRSDLADYQDLAGNNLLHITINTLISKQHEENYAQLQKESENLIFYLVNQKNVSINGRNDGGQTPLVLLCHNNIENHHILAEILIGRGATDQPPSCTETTQELLKVTAGCCQGLAHIFVELLCGSKQD